MVRALSTEDLQTLLGIAKRSGQAEAALAAVLAGVLTGWAISH